MVKWTVKIKASDVVRPSILPSSLLDQNTRTQLNAHKRDNELHKMARGLHTENQPTGNGIVTHVCTFLRTVFITFVGNLCSSLFLFNFHRFITFPVECECIHSATANIYLFGMEFYGNINLLLLTSD